MSIAASDLVNDEHYLADFIGAEFASMIDTHCSVEITGS